VDLDTPLLWEDDPPQCELECPDPSPSPVGYVKNSSGLWECDEDFMGIVDWSCSVKQGSCAVLFDFEGCTQMAPCRAPFLDTCEFVGPDCAEVRSGKSCEISCQPPYIGEPVLATCPDQNEDLDQVLEWTPPICTSTACPDLAILPEGYVQTSTGFACAPGYAGVAQKVCRHVGTNCTHLTSMTGCAKIIPCRLFETPDPCQYDISECLRVEPGSTCRLRCKEPFTGGATTGYCLADNTKDEGLLYLLPKCQLGRGWDPLWVPTGYLRTAEGWRCAPGFSGKLELQCDVLPNCNLDIMPTGCEPVLPCGVEPFSDMDGRAGFISGEFRFGPAQRLNRITEGPLLPDVSYEVFFADSCNYTVGEALVRVSTSGDILGCCMSDAYVADIQSKPVPRGISQLVVVARTSTVNVTPAELFGQVVPFQDKVVVVQSQASQRHSVRIAVWFRLAAVTVIVWAARVL